MIDIERRISNDTRLIDLTVGELKDLITSIAPKSEIDQSVSKGMKRYVYGINGIAELFNCSLSTARKLKDGKLREAVSQNGRKIIVDADLAVNLFNDDYRQQKKYANYKHKTQS